ncbi:MAG: hypothetical protein ACXQTS_06905 [Candidatus Methanospirareceae archaeon]
MGAKEALEAIEEEIKRNKAYLKVLNEYFEPGRKKTRLKAYFQARNEALEKIKKELLS